MNQNLPIVLQQPAPQWNGTNPQNKFGGHYRGDITVEKYQMRTRSTNQIVNITVPDPEETHLPNPKQPDGFYYPVDVMYNCICHALDTFHRTQRRGYWVDLYDFSLWNIVHDPFLVSEVKAVNSNQDECSQAVLPGDVIVFWKDPENAGGPRSPYHAAKIEVAQTIVTATGRRKLTLATTVSTKNGQGTPKVQSLRDMFIENKDYILPNHDMEYQGNWGIYHLLGNTVI